MMTTHKERRSSSAGHIKEQLLAFDAFDNNDWDIEDEISCEDKPNWVYDSSKILQIKNSLIISKGNTKEGFWVSAVRESDSLLAECAIRGRSFKDTLTKTNKFEKEWNWLGYKGSKSPQKSWTSNASRKTSTEILMTLQKKIVRQCTIHDSDFSKPWSMKKLLIIKE